jgi:hypothetical protein
MKNKKNNAGAAWFTGLSLTAISCNSDGNNGDNNQTTAQCEFYSLS